MFLFNEYLLNAIYPHVNTFFIEVRTWRATQS